jgi:hypothetical protein
MSVSTLLYFLVYIILFIIAIIFLVTLFPLNVSFLSTVDGFYYDAAVDFGVLLGLLFGSVGFDSKGGSFKLQLFSFPVYSTRWVKEEPEQKKEPKDTRPKRSRRNIRKLYEPSKRLFDSFTQIINVQKLDVSVTAGLSDPYISGLIFGVAYPVVEMTRIIFPPLSFSLTPVFVDERIGSRLDGIISLRIILIVVPLLCFFLSKEYREYRRT